MSDSSNRKSSQRHWLVRPRSIRLLWLVFSLVLAVSVLAGLWIQPHEPFPVANRFAFSALYGFLTCVGMVLLAKLLGSVLKRPEDYYTKQQGHAAELNPQQRQLDSERERDSSHA